MKTSKILSTTFSSEWGTGANLTYYYLIQLEGEPKAYTIGSKSAVVPPELTAGNTLQWEFKDEAKGNIKKYKAPFVRGAQQGSSTTQAAPVADPLELRVSTGLIAASVLYAAGKIEKAQINEIAANVARKFDEIKASL